MNPQTTTAAQASVPIEIICGDGSRHLSVLSVEIPPIVNEFMAMHGIPKPRTSTQIRVSKPNGALEIHVQADYMNGARYVGSGSHYNLKEAVEAALHSAFYTPQFGPGLPHKEDNGFETISGADGFVA